VRVPVIVTRAQKDQASFIESVTDWWGKAFVRIFSPDDAKAPSVGNNFTGRISHHSDARKPFADGFSSNAPLPPSSSLEPTDAEKEGAAGYVEDAVKGVVAGFPKIEETEPNWTGATTAWKGEVHQSGNKRNARDGFHVKRVD